MSLIQDRYTTTIRTTNLKHDIEEMTDVWMWLMDKWPLRFFYNWLYKLFLFLVVMPLFYVYMNGPSLGGYGAWGGKSLPDICSTVTNVDSHYWTSSKESMAECEIIVFREFNTFLVGVCSIMYFMIVAKIILSLLKNSSHVYKNVYQGIVHKLTEKQDGLVIEETVIVAKSGGEPVLRRSIRKSSDDLYE